MRVRVYKNLHKSKPGKPVYSVVDCKTGRVAFHAEVVALGDVTFVVRPAGRAKVLREKRKQVHAFAQGLLIDIFPGQRTPGSIEHVGAFCEIPVRYNPYEADHFRTLANRRVDNAHLVLLDARGCLIWP